MNRRMICAAAAACLATGAAAQTGAGMTLQQIGAAAEGAPMNGGVVSLQQTTAGSIPYYVANIPNTDLQFAISGIGCGGAAGARCDGLGMIFVVGPRARYESLFHVVNAQTRFVKFYATDDAAVMTSEQVLIGGGASTVRASIDMLAAGIARMMEVAEAGRSVEIRDEAAAVTHAPDGPPVKIVLTGVGGDLDPEKRAAIARNYVEASYPGAVE